MILDLPILDTRSKAVGLMGRFVADLVVQIMAYLADAERKKNREAQRAGIEAKKARGEWDGYGRPRKVSQEKFEKYFEQVQNRKMTDECLMNELQISQSTYVRYVRQLKEKNRCK